MSVLSTCVTWKFDHKSEDNVIWYFIDFVSEVFTYIIEKYLILYNDVYTMIFI